MIYRKLRKLIKNPKKFIVDSKLTQHLPFYKNHQNISIIRISENNKKDSQNISLWNDLIATVKSCKNEYIKILEENERLNINYISEDIISKKPDMIFHGYAFDDQNTNDTLIQQIISKNNSLNRNEKKSYLPSIKFIIFKKSILLDSLSTMPKSDLDLVIRYLNLVDIKKTIQTESIKQIPENKIRLNDAFLEICKQPDSFIEILTEIETCASLKLNNAAKNSLFLYFICFISSLLRNKKPDELTTERLQNNIFLKITNITELFDNAFIKSFESNIYNHHIKIGLLNIIKNEIHNYLYYIESIDEENKKIKLKVAADKNYLPEIKINEKNIIHESFKEKKYTIYKNEYISEFYFWISFDDINDSIQIANDEGFALISGKKVKKFNFSDAILSYKNKVKLSPKIPIKAKILRQLSQLNFVKNKFDSCWLITDNDLRADDNAEHLYRYINQNRKDINSYFLLSKKSSDWSRLKAEGFRLIPFGGLLHRLALLNASYLLSSHANPAIVNFLPKKHFVDLLKYKFVFLQHGITKDDQSEWLNSRDIRYLVTAAKPEHNDIAGDGRYKFTRTETLLSGFSRYDALSKHHNLNQNEILIMPTWRKSLSGELIKRSSKRIKNENFKNSLFCSQWSSVLKSKELLELAEKHSLKITFYPHPNLIDYIDDLEIPSHVNVATIGSESIQNVFRRAKLLITDFSSVAFDIAYMRKPVIYFQFDTDVFFSEHSYSKGYYDYQAQGFGPVCETTEQLIQSLETILDTSSESLSFYLQRINEFFPFNDQDNSKRLIDNLLNPNLAIQESSDIDKFIIRNIQNSKYKNIIEYTDTNEFESFVSDNTSYNLKFLFSLLKDDSIKLPKDNQRCVENTLLDLSSKFNSIKNNLDNRNYLSLLEIVDNLSPDERYVLNFAFEKKLLVADFLLQKEPEVISNSDMSLYLSESEIKEIITQIRLTPHQIYTLSEMTSDKEVLYKMSTYLKDSAFYDKIVLRLHQDGIIFNDVTSDYVSFLLKKKRFIEVKNLYDNGYISEIDEHHKLNYQCAQIFIDGIDSINKYDQSLIVELQSFINIAGPEHLDFLTNVILNVKHSTEIINLDIIYKLCIKLVKYSRTGLLKKILNYIFHSILSEKVIDDPAMASIMKLVSYTEVIHEIK